MALDPKRPPTAYVACEDNASLVVVDLTDVSFLDSRAIALLVAEHRRRVDTGAHLVVKGSSSRALRTFAVTGVDQVLDLDGDSPTR